MKKLNLNSRIKFRLNDYGKDIFYHRFDELNERIVARGGKPLEPYFPKVDEHGFSEFQLWDFIEIYGDHIGMGRREFWSDFNFYIDDGDLDDVVIKEEDDATEDKNI